MSKSKRQIVEDYAFEGIKLDIPKHEHRFTVPVEWRFKNRQMYKPSKELVEFKIVTKLRCESCPDEIAREAA